MTKFHHTKQADGAHHFTTEINGITEDNVTEILTYCRDTFGPEIGSGSPGTWCYFLERHFAKGMTVNGNGTLRESPSLLHKGLQLDVQFGHDAEAAQFRLRWAA